MFEGLINWWANGESSAETDARGAAADAGNRALTETKRAQYGEQWYQQVQANYASQPTGSVDDAIDEGFNEGLQEGADNITGAVSGVFGFTGKALGSILKGIPWWVWLLAGVALFVYLGGHTMLARVSRNKLAAVK